MRSHRISLQPPQTVILERSTLLKSTYGKVSGKSRQEVVYSTSSGRNSRQIRMSLSGRTETMLVFPPFFVDGDRLPFLLVMRVEELVGCL
ncbi:hypothetical protein AVEN_214457-1 [Araneus ventricosus]|uniref:Uncharacterized protein n=1 Tax=Araneus ventricosus TaxID=182803 RepID=A0A4Y2CUS4_ARAVE|nr:hypothetical protein AVEN_214457-1 [Araneus ventricosus]